MKTHGKPSNYRPGHFRSQVSNVFAHMQTKSNMFPQTTKATKIYERSYYNPIHNEHTSEIMKEIDRTGATNYQNRRMLEMYNHDTVRKASELMPSVLNKEDPNLQLAKKRELKLVQGKFDQTNAKAMSDWVRQKDLSVLIPSTINKSGWQELSQPQYLLRSCKK